MVASLSALIALFYAGVGTVGALEISIENNGGGAEATVEVAQVTTTTVGQTNQTNVNNDVQVSADTGNNTASDNGGEVQVTTGDITLDTQISNTVNQSQVAVGCCNGTGETQVIISGNGAGSTNP